MLFNKKINKSQTKTIRLQHLQEKYRVYSHLYVLTRKKPSQNYCSPATY